MGRGTTDGETLEPGRRALLEAEREKVLAVLARNGMAVTDIARAVGVAGQMAHHWLRDEE